MLALHRKQKEDEAQPTRVIELPEDDEQEESPVPIPEGASDLTPSDFDDTWGT